MPYRVVWITLMLVYVTQLSLFPRSTQAFHDKCVKAISKKGNRRTYLRNDTLSKDYSGQ